MLIALFLLVGTAIFFSCGSSHSLTEKITNQDLPTDSVVSMLLGDTISSFLYSPSAVYAYKMRPQKTETDTLIVDYAIDYLIGELDVSYYSILQFFLKDSSNYVLTNEKVKTPFSPNIGFEFVNHNQEKVYLLLAFNGNQLELIIQNQVILHRQFRNERFLLRFVWGLLPENEYIKSMLNTLK